MSNISPEERLLRLIKGQTNIPDENVIKAPLKKEVTDKKSTKEKKEAVINIKKINGLFIIVMILLVFYFVWEQFLFRQKLTELTKKETTTMSKKTEKTLPLNTLPELSYYTQVMGKRDLFTASGRKMQPIQEDITKKISESVKNLSLIGIVREEHPQAIIEDKSANKTYFLYKGDRFGEFEVKDIFENKVILILDGQEIELVI